MNEEARWAARKRLLLNRMAHARAILDVIGNGDHTAYEKAIDDAIAILSGLPPPSSLPPRAAPWGYPKPPSAPSPPAPDSDGAPPSPSDHEKP